MESVVSILPWAKVQDKNLLSFVSVLILDHACDVQNNMENGSFRNRGGTYKI